jgi:hypothetical protein
LTLSDSCRLLRRQGARGSPRPLNRHQQQHRSTSPLFTIRILDDKRPGYNRHGRAHNPDQDRLVRDFFFFSCVHNPCVLAYWQGGGQDENQKLRLRLRLGHRLVRKEREFRRRESITCKAQTPDISSFFVAFTSNIKSRPVINILWHLLLVTTCGARLSTCRAKLSTSQCCSRLACAIYGSH